MSELYPSAVLGFRAWTLREPGRLCSVLVQEPWSPAVSRAVCRVHAHEAPADACHCGFNAFHELERATELAAALYFTGVSVAGAIAGRGLTRVHEAGFRCAEAQVIALLAPGHWISERTRELLEAAAAHHGAPILERAALLEHAGRLAAPAPRDLRPPAQSASARGLGRQLHWDLP